MARQFFLCCFSLALIFCLVNVSVAQMRPESHASQTASSPVQVVYVIESGTIVTYDIDPQTLTPTQVGSLTLPGLSNTAVLYPSGDDHFLYVYSGNQIQVQHLWVFKTDASGAPLTPATQQIEVQGFFGFETDPTAGFVYVVTTTVDGLNNNKVRIVRYLADANTGAISQPVTEATYILPNGFGGGTNDCWLYFDGFNAAGTEMYNDVFCGNHEGIFDTDYKRTVNQQTGALGPDQQVYTWGNDFGGSESVRFVNNLMFDFVVPDDWQQGINYESIYDVGGKTTLLLQCTATMLYACGNAGGAKVHSSGQYLFMELAQGQQTTTEIDRVDLNQKEIGNTGNLIPLAVQQFSPDGTLVYAQKYAWPAYFIEIYGFDVSTGAVTAGGAISVPNVLNSYFVAERK